MQPELIAGQCESCGHDFEFLAIVEENVIIRCPSCRRVTDNWDTVAESQFAPVLVKIINEK